MLATTKALRQGAAGCGSSLRFLVLASFLGGGLGVLGTGLPGKGLLLAEEDASGSKKGGLSWDFLDPGTFELSLNVSGSFSDVQDSDAEEKRPSPLRLVQQKVHDVAVEARGPVLGVMVGVAALVAVASQQAV